MQHLLIAVPLEDASDLTALQETLQINEQTLESKPFDGDTVLQLMVPLTMTSVPLLHVWIKERSKLRRAQSFSFKGMKFKGYSVEEIAELKELMQEAAASSEQHDA